MRNRIETIRTDLNMAQQRGLVRDWYAYAPGDGWRRWVVTIMTADMGPVERTLATREVERIAYRMAAGEAVTYEQVNAL